MKSRILKSLRTVELFKILATNLLSVDKRKDDPHDLVVYLPCECSSNLGAFCSFVELSFAKFISLDAGLFDDLMQKVSIPVVTWFFLADSTIALLVRSSKSY